jgi:hypothetical protein
VAASITSDSIGRYLHSRRPHPLGRPSSQASSSTSGASSDDAYRAAGLPLPGDIRGLSGQQAHIDMAQYFLEDMLHLISYISDTLRIPVHSVMDVVREHQSPGIVPHTQAATPVTDDTPMHSSQHSAPGSRHSTDDSSIRVGDVHITAEGLDDFGEQLRGLSEIDTSSSLGISSYMDLLFGHGSSDSTPLPSQIHSPLHSDLLGVGHGVSGSGASVDDTMEYVDHPPPPETHVHI